MILPAALVLVPPRGILFRLARRLPVVLLRGSHAQAFSNNETTTQIIDSGFISQLANRSIELRAPRGPPEHGRRGGCIGSNQMIRA